MGHNKKGSNILKKTKRRVTPFFLIVSYRTIKMVNKLIKIQFGMPSTLFSFQFLKKVLVLAIATKWHTTYAQTEFGNHSLINLHVLRLHMTIYVTVGLVRTGPLVCRSVDKGHLLRLWFSRLPSFPIKYPNKSPTHELNNFYWQLLL